VRTTFQQHFSAKAMSGQHATGLGELLNVEIFTAFFEAQVPIENWKKDYNHIGPHNALGYRPPVSEAIIPSCGSSSLL